MYTNTNNMKYLFITLEIQDGENQYTQRVLHTTRAKNIMFAAERYAAGFISGESERLIVDSKTKKRDTSGWWYTASLERACRLHNVLEISEYEYKLMSEIFSGGRNRNSNFFRIISTGYNAANNSEEIQINAGLNGEIYLERKRNQVVVNVENKEDILQSITVWDEDLNCPIE